MRFDHELSIGTNQMNDFCDFYNRLLEMRCGRVEKLVPKVRFLANLKFNEFFVMTFRKLAKFEFLQAVNLKFNISRTDD